MRRLLSIVGARPQFVKAAELHRALAGRAGHLLLHTGQHYDREMSRVFFEELGIPEPAVNLGAGAGPHGAQTARMLEGIEQELAARRPDAVIVYGDTNSTIAGALAAAKLRIPIAHVEAGLRSHRKAMPEEVNRVLCDHCSTWLFCPTQRAVDNLLREGIATGPGGPPSADRPQVLLTGDLMLDSALRHAAVAQERSDALQRLGLAPEGFLLATVHRDFNADDPGRLRKIMEGLDAAAAEAGLPLLLPAHPRLRARLGGLAAPGARIRLIAPVGYLDMIALERAARLILTDSGGVQKEAAFFGRPCVVLREETEWTELVDHGQAALTGADAARIRQAAARFLRDGLPACPPLYGDGRAAQAMAAALLA